MNKNCNKNEIKVVKSCSLSVIPEVDQTSPKCTHEHTTECIYEESLLEHLAVENEQQSVINRLVDKELQEFSAFVREYEETSNLKKNITYTNVSKVKTTLFSLINSGVALDVNEGFNPFYIIINSDYELNDIVEANIDLYLKGYNSNDELIIDINAVRFNKIKKVKLESFLIAPNIWDSITRVELKPLSNNQVVLNEDINVEVKLLYNLI